MDSPGATKATVRRTRPSNCYKRESIRPNRSSSLLDSSVPTFRSLQRNERTEISNVIGKSGLLLENAVEFAKAAANWNEIAAFSQGQGQGGGREGEMRWVSGRRQRWPIRMCETYAGRRYQTDKRSRSPSLESGIKTDHLSHLVYDRSN